MCAAREAVRQGHAADGPRRPERRWPKRHPLTLSFPLSTVTVGFSEHALAALRTPRALVVGDETTTSCLFEVLGDDGLPYRLAFRDTLPSEDEHGLINIAGQNSGF